MIRKTTFTLTLLLVSLFTAFANASSSDLRRHKNNDGRYQAMMPSNASSIVVPGKNLTDTQYVTRARVSGGEFKVRVQVISPIDLDAELTKLMRDNFINQAREQLQKAYGKAAVDKAVQQHGVSGRDFMYRIKTANGTVILRQRVLFDGNRLYIATVTGNKTVAKSSAARDFLNSVQPL